MRRIGAVIVVELPPPRYRGSSLLRYAWAYAEFVIRAYGVVRARSRRGRLAVLQTSNLPNALGLLAWFVRHDGVRCVHDVHDPEPELFLSRFGNGVVGRLGAWALGMVERVVVSIADAVLWAIEPDPAMRLRLGVLFSKIHHVPNLPDGRIFPLREPVRKASRRVVFHGTVAKRFGLDRAVEAVAILKARGVPCTLEVVGEGDAVADLRNLVSQLCVTDRVVVSGQALPLQTVPALLETAAVGIVPLRRDIFIDCCVPTKLLEYIRLGIPVVATATPALERLFPSGTIHLLNPAAPEDFARELECVLEEGEDVLARARRAQRLPIAASWQDQERRYVELLTMGTPTAS